ncbi:MAG: hypothetical protein M3P06_20215 [Acidobacteriota bacterium]|nr:hypothetical protein [Acidobacteriota bacterium]
MFTLDDPASIPLSVLRRLAGKRQFFERATYFSHLLEDREIRDAAEELDSLIAVSRVRGYHCSKELERGLIQSRGLRPLSINEHLDEFLAFIRTTAPHITDEFVRTYESWRVNDQMEGREGRIWFCLSRDFVINGGTEGFFRYYGGEALYWPFDEGSSCLAFLESLGRPVVVEVVVPADAFTRSSQLPFARTLLGQTRPSLELGVSSRAA